MFVLWEGGSCRIGGWVRRTVGCLGSGDDSWLRGVEFTSVWALIAAEKVVKSLTLR